jgi:RimJ/RimL family protein N-acetyltransferase
MRFFRIVEWSEQMKIIETARLVLRPFRWEDFEAIHRLAYADPEVAPWWTGRTKTLDEGRDSLVRKVAQPPGEPDWVAVWVAITLKRSGTLIGGMGLQRWLPDEDTTYFVPEYSGDAPRRDPRVIEVEVTPVLGRAYWGHGHAIEAGRALLACGFGELGVERVLSTINSANVPSIRLAQRLGCRIRRNLHPRPSRYRDTPGVYAVLERSEWAAAAVSASSSVS